MSGKRVAVQTPDLSDFAHGHLGHDHLPALRMSRRRFLGLAVGGATVLTAGRFVPVAWAQTPNPNPKPINGGAFPPFRFYSPAYNEGGPPEVYDQSSITDFDGVFASTDVTGWGKDHTGKELYFRCDMRMMIGQYIGADGVHRAGSFGFI